MIKCNIICSLTEIWVIKLPVIDRTTIYFLVEPIESNSIEREAFAACGCTVVLVASIVTVTPTVATFFSPDARSFVFALPWFFTSAHRTPEQMPFSLGEVLYKEIFFSDSVMVLVNECQNLIWLFIAWRQLASEDVIMRSFQILNNFLKRGVHSNERNFSPSP